MAFTNVGSLHIPWGNVTDKPSTFPPSSHTHSYLPLSGGTLTGGLTPQGGITYWGNDDYIGYPYGGVLMSQSSSITGYLKITLPVSWNSCMMKFKVSIYNYVANASCDYFIGGYNFNGGSNGFFWTQTSAYSIGDDAGNICNLPVRFYHDGSKCCVGIGETTTEWAYPQVVISDLTIGFIGGTYADFRSGWNLSITSTAFTNVSETVTSPYVGSSKYAPISHTHSQYAPTSHTHTFTQISDRGTYIYDATLSRTANTVLAAPNGSNGAGTFRKLVSADIPSLDAGKIASGILPVARGGTGVTSNPSMLVNLGSASAASVFATSPRPGITGTLSIEHGGTGRTTRAAASRSIFTENAPITSTSSDTTADWGAQGPGIFFYSTSGQLTDQPSKYGFLLNFGHVEGCAEVHQLWATQSSGNLAHRGGNSAGWTGTWRTILDTTNYTEYCAAASHTHSYLPLSGGTLTGGTTITGTYFNYKNTNCSTFTASSSATAADGNSRVYFINNNNQCMGEALTGVDSTNYSFMRMEAVRPNGSATYHNALNLKLGPTGQYLYSVTSAAAFRNSLGLGNTSGALPVANGGTGATARGGAHTSSGLLYKIGLQAGTDSAPSSGNAGMVYIQYS